MRTWFAVTLLMSTLPVAAQAAEITVDMQEADYSPAMVDAQLGDRILFVTDDVVDHEVFVPTVGHGRSQERRVGTTGARPCPSRESQRTYKNKTASAPKPPAS